jgi:predicted RNase H-like HicB family nuclease
MVATEGVIVVKYLIVIEKGDQSYGAYAPDLPGCIAVGETPEETERLMREAIALHLRGLREDGLPIPAPATTADYVEVA